MPKEEKFMEFTKDIILNVEYDANIGRIRLKKEAPMKRIQKMFNENKFIVITLGSIATLIAIDIALVNAFMNLIIRL